MSGCAGCGSSDKEIDVESINERMEDTKRSLDEMVKTVNSFSVNTDYLSTLEEKLQNMTDYLQGGEFFNSMKDSMEMMQNMMPTSPTGVQMPVMPTMPTFNAPPVVPPASPKEPVAWIYIDENGTQQFSMTKPEGVTSTPLYS